MIVSSKLLDFGHLTNYVVYAGNCHNEVEKAVG